MQGSYLKNAAILTAAGLALRAAGMGLRIYLAAQLGGEGMGVYQLVYTLYGVSIALATSGIQVACTRLAAEALARGDGRTVRRLMRRLAGLALLLGLGAGALQLALAEPAARYLLGDLRTVPALRVLAFSLPFMSVGAAWRSYFMAARNVLPNVKAQLAEQAVRVAVIVWALRRVDIADIAAACAWVLLGNTVSEAVSCLLMLFYSRRALKAQARPGAGPERQPGWRRVFGILLPVEGSRCVSSALHAAETSLVPACLTLFLGSRREALAQFGAVRGMALPLVTFPFSFLATLSGLLMPEIARAHAQNDHASLEKLVGRTLALTLGVSLFAGAFFVVWAEPLGELVYHDRAVGGYLVWLGAMVPFMYLESMVDGIMKGMGEQLASFRYGLADSILRLAGVAVLLPRFGVAGYLWVMAASNLLTCGLNFSRMLRVTGLRFRCGAWLVRPCFFLMAALTVCLALQNLTLGRNTLVRLGLAGGGMALCYGLLLWRFSLRGMLKK